MSNLRIMHDNTELDPYYLLKLPYPCTHLQLDKQFRHKALRFHPDKNRSQTGREAYALLTRCKEAIAAEIVELRTTAFEDMRAGGRARAEADKKNASGLRKGTPADFFANSDHLVYRENPFDQNGTTTADLRANREEIHVRRIIDKYDRDEVAEIFEYNRVKNNKQLVQREIVPFNMTKQNQGTLLAPSATSVTRAQTQGYHGLSRLQDAYVDVEYGRLKPQAQPVFDEKRRLAELQRDVDCGPRRAWNSSAHDDAVVQRIMEDNRRNQSYVEAYNRRFLQ